VTSGALEKRRFPRIPLASAWSERPGRPMLVNVSGGGACVWLNEPPFVLGESSFFLYLQSSVRKLLLRARLVWMRPCEPHATGGQDALPPGWLAGVAFAPGQTAVSSDGQLGDDIEVDLLPAHGPHPHRPGTLEREDEPVLSGHAVASFQAAAEGLLPVLAKHFTDVKFVLTRDRLEVSAPFRPIEDLSGTAGKRNPRTVEPAEVRLEAAATSAQPATLPESAEAAGRDGEIAQAAIGSARNRRLLFAALSLAVVAFVGLNLSGVFSPKRNAGAVPRDAAAQEQARPAWAEGLGASALPGWIAIRDRFGLSDAAIRSAIRALKANDRYATGHAFRNLTAYPAQVERAFAIVADRKAGTSARLGALKEDLQGRLASGARFPDEEPGSRYFSNLDPRLYNNTIVLAIVELLHRHRAEPDARDLLAALAGS